MSSVRRVSIGVLALVLVLALSSVALAQATPKVTVRDQAITNSTVTIPAVVAAQDGWLVVHAQANGHPGPDLGHAAVKAGTNTNVVVKIDASKATPVLYAMLHIDAGQKGVYEFPGADVPVQGAQANVNPTFRVTNLAAAQGGKTSSSATGAASAAAAQPKTLPKTGNDAGVQLELLGLGVLCLLIGAGLTYRREAKQRA